MSPPPLATETAVLEVAEHQDDDEHAEYLREVSSAACTADPETSAIENAMGRRGGRVGIRHRPLPLDLPTCLLQAS